VGFVFQHYALFRHMTVQENVAFGLRVRPRRTRPKRAAIRERVSELLRLVQLERFGERFPHQISGGQRQRVALARALAVEPRVLLLDEPFGALDARVRQELRRWLRRLHDEIHVTSLFVTHDQDEALDVADTVVVMNEGRVRQVGTPDEVFHHPATPFVMGFLGQVNRFRARLHAGQLHFGSGVVAAPDHAHVVNAEGTVFVRPHDMLVLVAPNGRPSVPATVTRVHAAGSFVRVELRGEDGGTLLAELPQAELRDLALQAGALVHVAPRHVRFFTGPRPDR
jgi:sulfate transport system ATP-binding protein